MVASVQFENTIVEKGYFLQSVQGVFVDRMQILRCFSIGMPFNILVDLFYILRNRSMVKVVFSNSLSPFHDIIPSINPYRCILFLSQYYSTLLKAKEGACDHKYIASHFVTLRALAKWNAQFDLNSILQGDDPTHVLVVEKILLQTIHAFFPRPALSDTVPVSSLSPPLQSFVNVLFSCCASVYQQYGCVFPG